MSENHQSEIQEQRIEQDRIIYSINEKEQTASIVDNNKARGDIIIPKSIFYKAKEYIVESIKQYSFCISQVKSILIPSDSQLKTIDEYAFTHSEIESLTIQSSLVELKDHWCAGTAKLNKIEIDPNNSRYLKYDDNIIIGKSSPETENYDVLIFCNRNAVNVTIPNFIKRIAASSFNRCQKIREINVPDDSELQIIDNHAFYKSSIETFKIPRHLTKIGDSAFSNCNELRKIEISIDSELQEICKRAFYKSSIEIFSIPHHLKIIGEYAFSCCNKLRTIEISNDSELQEICRFAFSKLPIEIFTIPRHLTKIGEYVFSYCNELRTIEIPTDSELQEICRFAFFKSSIETFKIPCQLKIINESAFSNCNSLRTVEIPTDSELRVIGKHAFFRSSIVNLMIPSKLEELTKGWCKNANKLTKINVDVRNPRYAMYDDIFIIGKSSNEQENFDILIFCVRNVKTVKIPKFIKHIDESAFYGCKDLYEIDIPNDSELQTIDNNAFNCTSLKNFSIPHSVNTIGQSAFSKTELQRIEIPKDSQLKTVNENAFSYTDIQDLTIPSSLIELNDGWCNATPNLTEINVDSNNPRYLKYNDNLIIGKSTLDADNYDVIVFCNRNAVDVTIPNFIKTIGSFSFQNCSNLSHINIPVDSELKSIDRLALYETKIKKLMIPSTLIELNDGWCVGTYFLEKIDVDPNNPRYLKYDDNMLIGKSTLDADNYDVIVFCNRNVVDVKIPSFIKTIGAHSLQGCINIQKINISEDSKLQTIEEYAFLGSSITSFFIPSYLTKIDEDAFICCDELLIIEMNEKFYKENLNTKAFNRCKNAIMMVPTNLAYYLKTI